MSRDMKEELAYLKNVKAKEVREKINNARKFCDVNEDATYKDFIDEQYRLEERIKALEIKLVDAEKSDLGDYALLNHKVRIKWLADGFEEVYCLVSPVEADVEENYISIESPLGKVLANGQLEEVLYADLPNGREAVKIIDIKVLTN